MGRALSDTLTGIAIGLIIGILIGVVGFQSINAWIQDKAGSDWKYIIPPSSMVVKEITSKVTSTEGKIITAGIILAFIVGMAGNISWIIEIKSKRGYD
ncbi:MAG: hypothetical protein J7L82_05000 [Staphylothermus sp.]|nr:hypothetical protein [Staphylothermus sp.]